jgi:hypothetical protein
MLTVRRFMLASLMVLLLPSSATAGGWWSFIHTDRSTVAIGQRVEAEAEVLFTSIRVGREAQDGRLYVYALRGLDYSIVREAMSKPSPRDWWSWGDADAVELVSSYGSRRETSADTSVVHRPGTASGDLCPHVL